MVYLTEIKSKTSFLWIRYFIHANYKYRYSYTNLCLSVHYESQFHMGSVNLINLIISDMPTGNTGFIFKLTFPISF